MRSPRILLGLLAAITVIVLAVFVLTITRDDDGPHTIDNAATPTTTMSTDTSATSSAPSLPPTTDLFGNRLETPPVESGVVLPQNPGSRPDPSRPDYLSAAPARMQWQRGWGGAALPFSASDGPTRIEDGVAVGFARTPQGAALAAVDSIGRALAAPEGIWQQAVLERYLGGGQVLVEEYGRSRSRTTNAAKFVTVPDGIRVRPGYSPDAAIVEMAYADDGGYGVVAWPMVWDNGDWRVKAGENGELLRAPVQLVPTLTGFGSWKTVP